MYFEERLIDTVKQYPVLYDSSHKDYYCVEVKESTWKELGVLFNEPGDALKKRWNYLRDCYRKASVKKKMKGVKYRTWKYEKQMDFLIGHLSNKSGAVRRVKVNQNEEKLEGKDFVNISNLLLESEASVSAESSTTQKLTLAAENHPRSTGKIISEIELVECSSPSAMQNYSFSPKKRKVLSLCDSTDHIAAFFRSAEATVRTFSALYQVQIKAEISSLISDYELKNLLASEQAVDDQPFKVETRYLQSNSPSPITLNSANNFDQSL